MAIHKLVRDRIPEIIAKKGDKSETYTAGILEYRLFLKRKLTEECDEFNRSDNPEEIADVLEVLDALCEHFKFAKKDIRKIKNKKAKEKGRFRKRMILVIPEPQPPN